MTSRRPGLFRLLTAVGAALALSVAGVLATAPAHAATGSAAAAPRSGPAVKTTVAMRKVRVTGLVTRTPDKNGDVWVRLADGAKVPIPAADEAVVMRRAAQEAGTSSSPDNTVTGNCGSSNLFLHEKSDDHPLRMTTGFTVVAPAIAYGWVAEIVGENGYNHTYTAGGTLDFDSSWSGSFDSPLDEPQDLYAAAVSPDLSFALLLDGTLCTSIGPSDERELTSPDAPVSWALSTTAAISHANPVISQLRAPAPVPGSSGRSAGSKGSGALTPALAAVAATTPLRRVTNTTVYPFSAVALLRLTYPDAPVSFCTGFLYAPNIVATAGHCLKLGKGGEATSVEVIPGNDNVNGKMIHPFGTCMGTTAFSVTGWIDQAKPQYDYGAVKLNCTVGNQTGWFGMSWTSGPLVGTNVTVTGYPDQIAPLRSMWMSSGTILSSPERQLLYFFDVREGESGGPLYTPGCGTGGYCALGVHAYGPSPATGRNFAATRITQAAFDNYQAWK